MGQSVSVTPGAYHLAGGNPNFRKSSNFSENLTFFNLLNLLLSSPRASAQAVTSKWQLRTTSPMNTNSLVGENWFLAKNGSWPGRL